AWIKSEPDLARHEAVVLERAQMGDVHAPEVIAFDEFGAQTTHPAVLMSKVSGTVDLHPADMDDWLKQQAITLNKIHQLPTNHFEWRYVDWFDSAELSVPSWSQQPNVFDELIDILGRPRPTVPHVFLHRDYHPTNVLWEAGHLTSVVDWVNGCIGPAMIDVGHCRLNLASLFGMEAADRFLYHWRKFARAKHYSAWWDICAFANGDTFSDALEIYGGWADFNKTDVTLENLARNLDELAKTLLMNFKYSAS
ncbi:MAG: aminoglycoside phosphotransferase family protein, partial [Chloroflexota bacterium]